MPVCVAMMTMMVAMVPVVAGLQLLVLVVFAWAHA